MGHPLIENIIKPFVGDKPGRVEWKGERSAVGSIMPLEIMLEKSAELIPKIEKF